MEGVDCRHLPWMWERLGLQDSVLLIGPLWSLQNGSGNVDLYLSKEFSKYKYDLALVKI